MNRNTIPLLVVAGLALAPCAVAQTQPVAAPGAFEEPATLDAATILRPEFVQGPHFTVRAPVPTYAGHNNFLVNSEFGVFEADGNTQLVQRIAEIGAIAKLGEISRTDEYKTALEAAAKSPVALAKNLAKDPVKTVSGVPKGIWKFMNRAGQSLKELGEKREHSPYEDNVGENLIGFSKTKRELALKLGVDPYSSNETLQKELNGIAWASFGGKMTISLALAPVGGPAGAVITGVNVSDAATQALLDQSPSDLRRKHLDVLLAMNVPRDSVVAFLNNPAYSPTHATLLVDALTRVSGVEGRAGFVELATEATDEIDALFFQRTAEVLARVHGATPLKAIDSYNGFPLALAADGTVVVALEWDYACWTENAAKFVQAIKGGSHDGWNITGHRFVLTGTASPKTKDELTALGIGLVEKALPGPLR